MDKQIETKIPQAAIALMLTVLLLAAGLTAAPVSARSPLSANLLCPAGTAQTLDFAGERLAFCSPSSQPQTLVKDDRSFPGVAYAQLSLDGDGSALNIKALAAGSGAGPGDPVYEGGSAEVYRQQVLDRQNTMPGRTVSTAAAATLWGESVDGMQVHLAPEPETGLPARTSVEWALLHANRLWIFSLSWRDTSPAAAQWLALAQSFSVQSAAGASLSPVIDISRAPSLPSGIAPQTGVIDVGTPAWWNGVCNDKNYYPYTGAHSFLLGGKWHNLPACGPRPWTVSTRDHPVTFFSGAHGELEFECVELVMRFLYQEWKIAPWSGNGNTIKNTAPASLVFYPNGSKNIVPGDVLTEDSSSSNQYGHTLVVTAVNLDASGTGKITILEQNSSPTGVRDMLVSAYTVLPDAYVHSQTVQGWLHAKSNLQNCPAMTSAVRLFAGSDCLSSTLDVLPGLTQLEQNSFDNLAQSAAIPAGWSARFYLNTNENLLESACLTQTDADFSDNSFANGVTLKNNASWVRVYQNSACALGNSLPAGYTQCALEGGSCSFSGQASVIFGASAGYSPAEVFLNTVSCSAAVFGDPVIGAAKTCYSLAASGVPFPPALTFPAYGTNYPPGTSLTFSWDPSADATEYLLEWSSATSGALQPCGWSSATTCAAGSAAPGQVYTWRVKARNANGEGAWSEPSTFGILPGVPGGLNASDGVGTAVSLSWNPAAGAAFYQVFRSTNGTFSETPYANGLTATQFVDDSVLTGLTYSYRVRACSPAGCGGLSTVETGFIAPLLPGDDFGAALPVGALPAKLNLDTSAFTSASDDPAFSGCKRGPGTSSAWFQFTPTLSQTYEIDTLGSSYDTMLAVWRGSRGALQSVGCNDDIDYNGGVNTSRLLLGLSANTTYMLEVAQYDFVTAPELTGKIRTAAAAPSGGTLSLNVRPLKRVLLRSNGKYDGGIREWSESSGTGGWINPTGANFNLGDDSYRRQFRAILTFSTSILPDNAVITSGVLKIRQSGLPVRSNPFPLLGPLYADLRSGTFGTLALESADFQAPATLTAFTSFGSSPTNSWYSANISMSAGAKINKKGWTQFRLRFNLDDNNDGYNNFMPFSSGDSPTISWRPFLLLYYYEP